MALTTCRECEGKVSTNAETCPHCGVAYPGDVAAAENAKKKIEAAASKARAQKGCSGIFGALIVIVVGLIILGAITSKDGNDSSEHAACKKDWRDCKDNAELVNHSSAWWSAKSDCKIEAENRAKYGTPEWPWFAFGTFLTGNNYPKTGSIVLIEKDAKFENGFGAKVRSQVRCEYDLKTKKVMDIMISERF